MFNVYLVQGKQEMVAVHSVVMGCLEWGKAGVLTPQLLLICYELNVSFSLFSLFLKDFLESLSTNFILLPPCGCKGGNQV